MEKSSAIIKTSISFIFLSALLLSLAMADTTSTTSVSDKGYQCLENLVKNESTQTLSLQEAIFATLALGNRKVLMDKLSDEKNNAGCWPKSSCTIKETAQVAMAYDRAGSSNDEAIKWLLANNVTSSDLNWFLEMDISNHIAAECTLKYDNSERKIKIGDDMKITGNPGSCFSVSQSGYWLLFRDNCIGKEIQVSCDQDFITTLIYTKKSGGTVYVLPDVHSASSLGTTSEKVEVKCFKSGSKCDYEGSLWATLALLKEGKNINEYIPYLVALADDNQKYFPSAFLYALTSADDQYSNIIQLQKQGRSWKMIATPYDEYYDTSLALTALSKTSSSQSESTKSYLSSIQNAQGCWDSNNLRNTAFILYSAWPKAASGGGGGGGTSDLDCEQVPTQSCELYNKCIDAGGRALSNFQCSGLNICCSIKVELQSCSAQQGTICSADQECVGRNSPSSDEGTCCLDTCEKKEEPVVETCSTEFSGTCSSTCGDNEEQNFEGTCSSSSDICCVAAPEKSGGSGWIIFLVILIIIVILAILFRDKLRLEWFKFRGKAKSTPVVKPGVPPENMGRSGPPFKPDLGSGNYPAQMPPRPVPNNKFATRTTRKPVSDKDKEFEETLKKLKDMSK